MASVMASLETLAKRCSCQRCTKDGQSSGQHPLLAQRTVTPLNFTMADYHQSAMFILVVSLNLNVLSVAVSLVIHFVHRT